MRTTPAAVAAAASRLVPSQSTSRGEPPAG